MIPSLAVVTPSYNDAGLLCACCESVARAAEQADFPVQHVVVDDGSTDETATLLPDLAATYGLTVERLLENRGCSAALNAAISLTSADWLLILASDDLVEPLAFVEWAAGCLEAPDANVIYSDLRQFGRMRGLYRTPPFDSALLRQRSILPGAAFLRRSLWDTVGGFDESMPSAQDWDFYVRADLVVGLRPHKRQAPMIRYRLHSTDRLHFSSARNIKAIRATVHSRTVENSVLHPVAA